MATMAERIYQAALIAADTGLTLEQQTVTLNDGGDPPTEGTFTLKFGDDTTDGIAFDATAAEVQAALEALDSIQEGDVVCTGGPLPGDDIVVQFQGRLEGNVAEMTAADVDLDDGTPAVSTTQAGVDGLRKDLRDAFEAFHSAISAILTTAGSNDAVVAQYEDDIVALARRFATELR